MQARFFDLGETPPRLRFPVAVDVQDATSSAVAAPAARWSSMSTISPASNIDSADRQICSRLRDAPRDEVRCDPNFGNAPLDQARRLLDQCLIALAGHFFQRGPVQYIDDAARVVDSACDLDFARDFRDRCPADAKHFGKKLLR